MDQPMAFPEEMRGEAIDVDQIRDDQQTVGFSRRRAFNSASNGASM